MLEDLRSVVEAEILIAHDNLEQLRTECILFGNSSSINGQMKLSQQSNTVNQRLKLAKDMGTNAKIDINDCLIREVELYSLLREHTDDLKNCVIDTHDELGSIIDDSKYYADIQYTKVNQLEFQLNSCSSDSISCISSILTLIQEGMVNLPNQIKLELQKTSELTETLKILYNDCQSLEVTRYSGKSNGIITEIFNCVTTLLS